MSARPSGSLLDLRLLPLRLLWATLPLTLGPLLADGLDPRRSAFRSAVSSVAWAVWAVTLVATLVPRTVTLTVVRIVVPATVPAAVWAALAADDPGTATTIIGLVAAVVSTIAAFVAPAGEAFVDGSSYGDERRMPLRPPGLLLLGPLELAWAVAVAGATAGPLLLADQQWVPGAVVTIVGFGLAHFAVKALHRLSRRWLVFVPAGFVVHDHLALAEPVLFPRTMVASAGIARQGTTATDLTMGALGVAVEARLTEATSIVPTRRDRTNEAVDIDSFLVAPSRPGAALVEAKRRRITVSA
jgi:hypothetical protein